MHAERLRYELDVVKNDRFRGLHPVRLGLRGWARERGIACGPRGSAAGSIILYLLGIADLDPIDTG